MEIWKDIIGYEGLYQISNCGNVKSLLFGPKNRNTTKHKPQLLKQSLSSTGYSHVQLYKDGISKTINVHRMVAIAFLPNPDGKPEINHIDANRSNNNVNNLEWVTHIDNLKHAVKLGNRRPPSPKGSTKGRTHKYSIIQYSLNGEFIKRWECVKDISTAMDLNENPIFSCLNNHCETSYGYIWVKHFPDENIIMNIQPRKGKPFIQGRRNHIAQFDKNMTLIKTWDSYKDLIADTQFGTKSFGNICKCINGKRKTANGFIWKYI